DKEGLFRSPKQPRKDVNISLPISNPFDVLTQQQDNSQDIPPNLQKPSNDKIPPVMIHLSQNYSLMLQEVNRIAPNTELVLEGNYIKLFPSCCDNHRVITSFLKEEKVDYYIIKTPSQKPIKVILKGLPPSSDVDDIKIEIEKLGFHVEKVENYLAVSGGHSTCTFDEFVNVDENLITAQLQEIGDIAAEILVNGGDKGKEMDNDKEKDTTTAKILTTHTAALETLVTLRDFFLFNSGSERIFSCLAELGKDSVRKFMETKTNLYCKLLQQNSKLKQNSGT
ncbi:uncharacterized protein NPIL_142331, partial [Nephila pilipes]